MCGICGVFALNGDVNPAISDAVGRMTESLRHRGPDGGGLFVDRRAALGHRRLAIIDRGGGAQPMTSETGTWVVFNGEIYNHRTLRRELASRGHRFRTTSDTEVILHAYQEYGLACVERLHGMFAFAVYDPTKAELFAARDRLGKKPLFYAVLDGVLHFASEIKALYQSPSWDGTIDDSTLEAYLSLGYIPAPSTIYKSVRKLEPGHWLHATNGSVRTGQYWDVEVFDDRRSHSPALQSEISDLLRGAVADRLESEVPLGAFLSGGIDSGLVVSYMAETLPNPVLTTSVGFGDRRHNELDAAALTAARWRTDHFSEIVAPRLDEVLDPVVAGFDEPFADASAIPTYYVSQIARRHVTVALSGDGGDETFGGYGFRYVPHAMESVVRDCLPRAARQGLGWLATVWPRSPRVPRALRWATLLDNVAVDADSAYFADLCVTKPHTARRLLGLSTETDLRGTGLFDLVTAPYRRCGSDSPIQRAAYADLKIYLSNDVLVKVDRMSMAHSLEVRCPLLDHRLVELAFRVPRSHKMPWLQAKYLLRQVARQRLPQAVVRLPKHGFSAPVREWLVGPYRSRFVDDVLTPASFVSAYVDTIRVRGMFDAQCRGEADHSTTLWAIWMLERWKRVAYRPTLLASSEKHRCVNISAPGLHSFA